MKPEEAIKVINTILLSVNHHVEIGQTVEEINKALDMAIEALKKPHGECGTCKHFVKGGLDGNTYVCEHPDIEQDDYYNYACLAVEEKDFCSSYEPYKKEGETE